MKDCLFCKIGSGNIPSQEIYEDKHAFAFLDINPRAPGHTMVIPKAHAATMLELPEKEMGPFFGAVKKVTGMIQKALKPDGFTMGINHGSVSGQTVEHLHFHIIPRWFSDGGGSIHSVVNNPPKEGLEEIAKRIKNA
ncbi:MAG: HIT family protein [Candidatus Portnoybacteria bacterium]|nr:HIT family protein [Candidatus Portnoybacteria bacterium]